MTLGRVLAAGLVAACGSAGLAGYTSMQQQNEPLLRRLQGVHRLSDTQATEVRRIFTRSGYIGQGDPQPATRPPPSSARTSWPDRAPLREPGVEQNLQGEVHGAPLRPSDRASGRREGLHQSVRVSRHSLSIRWSGRRRAKRPRSVRRWASGCVTRTSGRARAMDDSRRPTTASTWRGVSIRRRGPPNACGARPVLRASQAMELRAGVQRGSAARRAEESRAVSATAGASVAPNTFPDGMFPGCEVPCTCTSLNGNAAEHMNLPLNTQQMSSRGSRELGYTEMKGSWFVFDAYRAHEDWCRWRAPSWHG